MIINILRKVKMGSAHLSRTNIGCILINTFYLGPETCYRRKMAAEADKSSSIKYKYSKQVICGICG